MARQTETSDSALGYYRHTIFSLVPGLKTVRVFLADGGYLPDRVRNLRQAVRNNLLECTVGMFWETTTAFAFASDHHLIPAITFGLLATGNLAETGLTSIIAFLRQRAHRNTINANPKAFGQEVTRINQ